MSRMYEERNPKSITENTENLNYGATAVKWTNSALKCDECRTASNEPVV